MLVLALVPLAGCTPSQEQIAAQTATAQTAIAALWTTTPSPTATSSPTATATITPSPTITQTPTQTPTQTVTPLPLTRLSLKDVNFSFAALEGWKKSDDPSHLILYGPTAAGEQLILSFSLDQYSLMGNVVDADDFGISMFSAHVQDTVQGMAQKLVQVSEDFLTSDDEKTYFRWEMEHTTNGRALHQIFYIFGTGKWFLTVMYGRPISAGAENDEIVDAAMQTLVLDQSAEGSPG